VTTSDPVPARVALRITEAVGVALDGGPPVAVATVTQAGEIGLALGAKLLVHADGERLGALDGGALDDAVASAALEQMSTRPRVMVETLWIGSDRGIASRRSQADAGAATVMVQLFEAPARLVIVGAGHIGFALATVGALSGFNVAVLDDREEFANREHLPMADEVYAGDLESGLDAFALGPSDYVVLVSRGHQVDELALRRTVGRGAAYVGMIGSRRRTTTVLAHLLEEGFAREDLEAVHTPIGIDIGAETPEEIAISILAEIILERRGGSGGRMIARRGRISSP
jgi:xanthine dehydrogenase accessory factor